MSRWLESGKLVTWKRLALEWLAAAANSIGRPTPINIPLYASLPSGNIRL
jgi:hypothetical protein